MKTLIFSIGILITTLANASDLPKVLLYGSVSEGNTEDVLSPGSPESATFVKDVMITVTCGEEIVSEYSNRQTGFYSVILESGKKYKVSFHKDGFITKNFEIDAESVLPSDNKKSFKMYTDVTLFSKPEKGDFSSYDRLPVAKCNFNPEKDRMEWNMEYARMAFNHFVDEVKQQHKTAAITEE